MAHAGGDCRGVEGESGDGVLPAVVVSRGGVRLTRNNVPTLRSRVLGVLAKGEPVTKYLLAEQLGVTSMQAHYCLVGLHRHKLVERIATGVMTLTERGKEACARLPPESVQVTEEATGEIVLAR